MMTYLYRASNLKSTSLFWHQFHRLANLGVCLCRKITLVLQDFGSFCRIYQIISALLCTCKVRVLLAIYKSWTPPEATEKSAKHTLQ